jgi:hypothetical protein
MNTMSSWVTTADAPRSPGASHVSKQFIIEAMLVTTKRKL